MLDLWQWGKDKEKENDVTDRAFDLIIFMMAAAQQSQQKQTQQIWIIVRIAHRKWWQRMQQSHTFLLVSMQVSKPKLKTQKKAPVPRLRPAQGLILTCGWMSSSLASRFPSLIYLIKQLQRQDINKQVG